MEEEQFDVVDQNDQVLRQAARSDVHRLKLLHRAVHVFVFRSDGRLLLHKRSPDKEEFPSVWTSSASGHVSAGEAYDESAPRELKEELGITASVERLHKFSACEQTSYEFTVLYRAVSDQPIDFDPGEITEICWKTLAETAEWRDRKPEEFSPAFCLLFDWYRQVSQ